MTRLAKNCEDIRIVESPRLKLFALVIEQFQLGISYSTTDNRTLSHDMPHNSLLYQKPYVIGLPVMYQKL